MTTRGPKLKIAPFDTTASRLDCGRLWNRWVERFERDLIYQGVDIGGKPDLARAALLIHAGIDVEDIHDTLPDVPKPEALTDIQYTTYQKSKLKLTQYFTPQICNDFAVFELISTKMRGDETVAAYTLRLRELAKKCDFTNWCADTMIKALVISNMSDHELRQKLLQKDRTLSEVLIKAQKKEDAAARDQVIDRQRKEGSSSSGGVNRLGGSWPNKKKPDKNENNKKCSYCGYDTHHGATCPASNRECGICSKKGHFAKMCHFRDSSSNNNRSENKKNVKVLTKRYNYDEDDNDETDSDGEDEHNIKKVSVFSVSDKITLMRVKVDGAEIVWQPDTGTKKNLMTATHFNDYKQKQNEPIELKPSKACLYPYGSEEKLTILGKFRAKFKAGERELKDVVYVTEEESDHPLISEDTAIGLGLVTYNKKFIVNKTTDTSKNRDIGTTVKQKFPELFTGEIGKFKDNEITLMVDETVTPVAQKPRRIPIHVMDKAENKVKQMLNRDIIERFPDNVPRKWIIPVVISTKPNGDIRFCLDMREPNIAIQRPLTPLPTIDEVEAKFSGAERFSKLDLKEAYNQFVLSEESRNMTAFYGPDGLYRFKRLNYGTKSAQDIMQIELRKILAGIEHQMNMADDFLIGGSETQHDKSLFAVCQALKNHGITLNPDKCIFDVSQVTFMGLVFSKEGVRPDAKHVKNLKEAKAPLNASELRSFLGMAGFSMRFIHNFANIVSPMRLMMKNKKWDWNTECQSAFEKLKTCLSEQTLLHHYVPGHDTEVIVDASLTGLGAVLVQRKSK